MVNVTIYSIHGSYGNGKSMKMRENGGNPLKYPKEKPQIWMIV